MNLTTFVLAGRQFFQRFTSAAESKADLGS